MDPVRIRAKALICERLNIPFVDRYDDLLVAEHRVLTEMFAANRGVPRPVRENGHQPSQPVINGRPVTYERI